MKNIILAVMFTLMFIGISPAHAQEVCDGNTNIIIDIGGKYTLCWKKNPEPDLKNYILYKNDVVMDTIAHSTCGEEFCFSPEYIEMNTGTYTFKVAASDMVGQVGPKSDPVTLVVEDLPPSKPSGCSIRMIF